MFPQKTFTILVADDDEEDRLLLEEAFTQNGLMGCGHFVENGEQAMAYLLNGLQSTAGLPHLVILDINMPLKNGMETLQWIRSHPRLKNLPVLLLTSSSQEIERAYHLGANSYLVKPMYFEDLIRMVGDVALYWRDTVSLPTPE